MSALHCRDLGFLKFGSVANVPQGAATVHEGPVAELMGNMGPVVFQAIWEAVKASGFGKFLLMSEPLLSIPAEGIFAPNGVAAASAVMAGKLDRRLIPPRRTVFASPRKS